ncbi:hypothetical protein HHI36_018784 [Cryptolaemus montrouzieri]|uniref:EGF-like domain-containing protein n=1 Tax=Cryptolaemus montrouzieri TaxID=559131 RepID=A0ABD2P248_9CUCU
MLTPSQLAHNMRPSWGRYFPPTGAASAEPPCASRPPVLLQRYLVQLALATTGFHRFLARFSGRRRWRSSYQHKSPPPWINFLVLVLASSLLNIVDACSSRTTPKPRPPPPPTPRPNISFPVYQCPPEFAAWYCFNGATCFTVKIGASLLYNCECAEGFMGPRCEYKDLDGSYLPAQRGVMLERASIAGGATVAVILMVILCVVVYLHYKRHTKVSRTSSDCVDSRTSCAYTPTFGTRWRTQPQVEFPVVHDRGDINPQSKVDLHRITTLVSPISLSGQQQEP